MPLLEHINQDIKKEIIYKSKDKDSTVNKLKSELTLQLVLFGLDRDVHFPL